MTKHFESLSGNGRPLESSQGHPAPSIADFWQDAVIKQNQFDHCKSTVEVLRGELDRVCAEIVKHGCNAERSYRTRMLEVSLVHARRQMEISSQQLDKAVTMLRRAHARQPDKRTS
jgi:hypothetical protein